MTLEPRYGWAWSQSPLDWCEHKAIPRDFARRYGVVGGGRVFIEHGRYQPMPHGEPALILACRGDPLGLPEVADPLDTITGGDLLDLCAVPLARPQTWALLRGAVCFIGAVEPQMLKPDPVPVWRSPFSWLQHSCVGLALLTHDRRAQADILRGLDIIAEDEAHGRELRAILEHPFPTPRIFTRKARAAA